MSYDLKTEIIRLIATQMQHATALEATKRLEEAICWKARAMGVEDAYDIYQKRQSNASGWDNIEIPDYGDLTDSYLEGIRLFQNICKKL